MSEYLDPRSMATFLWLIDTLITFGPFVIPTYFVGGFVTVVFSTTPSSPLGFTFTDERGDAYPVKRFSFGQRTLVFVVWWWIVFRIIAQNIVSEGGV